MTLTILASDQDVPEGTWYLQRVGACDPMFIPFTEKTTVIGREALHRKAKHVSEKHATFILLEEVNVVLIVDNNSEHGTYVNNKILPSEGQILRRHSFLSLGYKSLKLKSAKHYGFIVQYKDKTSGSATDSDCSTNSSNSRELPSINPMESPNEVAGRKRKLTLKEDTTQRSDSTYIEVNRIEQNSSAWNKQTDVQRTSSEKSVMPSKPCKSKHTIRPVTYAYLYNQASSQNVAPETSACSSEQTNALTQDKFPYAEALRSRHTSEAKRLSYDDVALLQNPERKSSASRRPKKTKRKVQSSKQKILKFFSNRIPIPGGGQDCKMR